MTKPWEKAAAGAVLVAEIAPDNWRVMAACWPDRGGLGFADLGWPANDGGHPFHYLLGPINRRDTDWYVGDVLVREVLPFEADLMAQWHEWETWRAAQDADYSPDAARAAGLMDAWS